jgi:hypothetical protein
MCGISAALSLVVSLFFLKYWQHTRERLFAAFAAAFAVLSVHWVTLGLADPHSDTQYYSLLLRLLAFVLMILGILDKNRQARQRR